MVPPAAAAEVNRTVEDTLADEAAELDGYFSDAPLQPVPNYPALNESFDAAIVITNLPVVTESKLEKLTKVVFKLVSRIGTLAACEETQYTGLHMPYDKEKDTTFGFCLVEYSTPAEAKNAVDVLQNYQFDKNHSLTVSLYARAKQLQNINTETFPEPDLPPFTEKPNAMEWLEDSSQRDSFVIRYGQAGHKTEVSWWDGGKTEPAVDYDGSREKEAGVVWCEYYCHWSPAGSYLATLIPARGVILWSGAQYEKTGRFPAPGVKLVQFSPQENYLLTNNEDPKDPGAIKVYHIPTGKLLRAFSLYPENMPKNVPPPPFLWSHDDKYLARIGDGLISIFETPGMKLLDKRSVATPGVHEFQWSPTDNILAYWAPEADNQPAHVDVMQIPSRDKLRQKNLVNVSKCSMVWHPQGDYLAVKVTRHTKSKKTLYNNIELFRLREPSVPVEMLDTKDAVMALAFEPTGSRFAMIHAENPTASKVNVSFYDMMKLVDPTTIVVPGTVVGAPLTKKQKQLQREMAEQKIPDLHKVETLEGRQCNAIFWSPAGGTILMASLGDAASGTLEFYDVDSQTLVVKEHYRANQVFWDPSGRSVATVVSQPIEGGHFKFAMDNGYVLWSFQGNKLFQRNFEAFYQFLWRPRESLLTRAEIKKVRRNLKKYEKQFDKADRERQRQAYLEETAGKRAERTKLRELLARNRALRKKYRAEHIALLGGYDSEDDQHYVIRETVTETVLSTKEEVVM